MLHLLRSAVALALVATVSHAALIVPGATWTDTAGKVIQAHGGGILKVGSTYYWHGEDKEHNSGSFRAVSCYSSTDLATWTRQTDALTPQSGTSISSSNIVERPKVIYNTKNSEYVMWFHSDSSNYGAAQLGVATSKTPCGPFTYKASWQPLGAQSRDMGIFVDDDATAYVLYASDNNQNFKIAKLDSDYRNVSSLVSTIAGSTLESPGIIKRNGVYHLFASHTTGWAPNPNKFFTASSLSGPWSSEADIAPSGTRTYFSQNTFDLPLGSNGIYMGDRWRPSLLGSSRYIWTPLSWSSGKPQIVWADVWNLDISAGTYSVVNGTSYEAEAGTIGGSAKSFSDTGFSGGKGVGYLGNGGTLSLTVQGTAGDHWIAIYHANGDGSWRNTTLSVNGGSSVSIDQPDTGSGHVVLSVPVKVTLKAGSNTLLFSSGQTNYAADIDKVIVY
ncbi:carbohydrate-binding module family 35 protein [Cylindrobasidium torrendii FP15055 ss-10]|uniref:Carbohydrate-binding module family 35 protein n=1 Tax=Cylindrobasidium torrendii FP15055 ss-10 TaxID=1314674 RepID=A0A0D7BHE7_9AGAR|nr:carbohydrate-binding module family 35 protein [Cylindrobasidium torrendii FP15055 ss-10]